MELWKSQLFWGIPRIIIREDNERIGLLDSPDTFLYTPLDRKLEDIFERALLTRGIRNYIYGNGFTAEKILDIIMKELKLMPTTSYRALKRSIAKPVSPIHHPLAWPVA